MPGTFWRRPLPMSAKAKPPASCTTVWPNSARLSAAAGARSDGNGRLAAHGSGCGAGDVVPKLRRDMAWVDWRRPAAEVSARIRGLSPWPGVQVELLDPDGEAPRAGHDPEMPGGRLQAHGPEECGQVGPDQTIACGLGSVELLTIQPVGKKPMDLRAFANGYRLADRMRFPPSSVPHRLEYDAAMKFMIRQASTTDVPTLSHIELATKLACYNFLTESQRARYRPGPGTSGFSIPRRFIIRSRHGTSFSPTTGIIFSASRPCGTRATSRASARLKRPIRAAPAPA